MTEPHITQARDFVRAIMKLGQQWHNDTDGTYDGNDDTADALFQSALDTYASERVREKDAEIERLKDKNERFKGFPMKYKRMSYNAELQHELEQALEENAKLRTELDQLKQGKQP